ncbi:unnamed protein product [Prorocentrum cordatum]|uniref:Integrase catalytic domain-containing protein n=1 Tax=Prorocentrum cordatum TaxID=2364126 RepID=A0ABN9VI49_9DINO|nr:unnamed protein product [Polarella glacialis]
MSVLVAETGDAVWLIVVDTACAKSVAGLRWYWRLAVYVRKNWGIELETVAEREPYRFGPGKTIYSSQALLLPMEWDGKGAVIRISLVDEDVPPLISGGALKALEAHIHMKEAEIILGAISKARHKLRELPSGHLAMAAVTYGPGGPGAGAKEAVSRCRAGAEIALYGRGHGSAHEAVRRALYTDGRPDDDDDDELAATNATAAPVGPGAGQRTRAGAIFGASGTRARVPMPPWRPIAVQCRSGAARANVAIRLVFMAWKAWYQELLVDYLEREVQTLRQREEGPRSIWQMREAELVTLTMQELGWRRDRAEAETVGQLRLALREKKSETKASEEEKDDLRTTLPKGLANMRLAELQEEAAVREIPLTRSSGTNKTREELIRDVRQFVSESWAQTDWIRIPVDGSRKSTPVQKRESTGLKTAESMEVDSSSGLAEPSIGSADAQGAVGVGKQGRGSARNRRLKGPAATAVRKACLGVASTWLLGVATLGTWLEETGGGQWARHRWGSDRVDVVEFFGGGSEFSRIGSKNGWWCLRPWDARCGADLAQESQVEALGMLTEVRPRLAVWWSSLAPPWAVPNALFTRATPISSDSEPSDDGSGRYWSLLGRYYVKFPDTPMGKSMAQRMTQELRRNLRRLHLNTGHASPEDLARLVAKAGGSEVAIAGAKALRCSSCAERPRARPPRPARLREDDLTFNEVVQADLFKIPDQSGTGWWFLLVQDVATGYCTIGLVSAHSSEELWEQYERLWLCWAGPPHQFVTDNERGLVSGSFVDALSRSGTAYDPTAAYAPWQKGKVERKIQEAKNVMRKTIRHGAYAGIEDMRTLAWEAASVLNHFPGQCGYSPSLLLFGQKMTLVGECWHEGKAVTYHPCVAEESDPLARRLKIREHCQQSLIKTRSQELVRRAVAARSRSTPAEWKEGERVFFFRPYRTERGRRVNEPEWCGPALVFGRRYDNVWVQYGGKPFLVAPEHLRPLSPEEQHLAEDADLARSLDEIRQAMSREEFEDLTGLNAGPEELAAADGLVQGGESEQEPEGVGNQGVVEVDLPAPTREAPGEEPSAEAQGSGLPRGLPHELGRPAADRMLVVFEDEKKRQRDPALKTVETPAAVRRTGEGPSDTSNRAHHVMTAYRRGTGSALLDRKTQDRELKWDEIAPKGREAFRAAVEKEWDPWPRYKCVSVLEPEASEEVLRTVDRSRILGSDMKLKDKNAALRTPENDLPLKAKARLCVQGQHDPDAKLGTVKTDAPTVQRSGFHAFLQLATNLGWLPQMAIGDISNAFPQGEPRKGQEPLYMQQPRGGLPGLEPGQLLKVEKGIYGLPDAPRAWFNTFRKAMVEEMGWKQLQLDVAFFCFYSGDRSAGMLIVHVDDCMLAHDGSAEMRAKEARLRERFPFGSWQVVAQQAEGDVYTSRRIRVDGSCVEVGMPEFVEGRLEEVKVDRQAKGKDPVSPLAKAEFQSATGSLHWLASQYRLDKAYETNRFQKLQRAPTWSDARELNKCIRDVKASGGVRLRIVPIKGRMGIGCWHDSSLYGNVGELVEGDEDLKRFDRHKVRPQAGAVVAAIDHDCLEQDELPIIHTGLAEPCQPQGGNVDVLGKDGGVLRSRNRREEARGRPLGAKRPAEPTELAEPARVERRATPPKRTGCGDGGGPARFTRRHLGGDGGSVNEYPSEHAALKLPDQFMVFTPMEVDKLSNLGWNLRLSNFFRVACRGALVPSKFSVEELAHCWNNVLHQDGRMYMRWALEGDPPAEARAGVEADRNERSRSARRAKEEKESEDDDPSPGRRTRRLPTDRSPSPETRGEERKGGKGSKGEKGKKGKGEKGSKGEKNKGYKGGKAKKGKGQVPPLGSISSEILKPDVCRFCFKQGHWGNECPAYYQDGTPKEH